MNKQRAQEIAASPVMANVTFQGTPIYIQHVDEKNETARIYPLDQPENEQEVPLGSLMEH
jgi:small acid-soluble spore protein H (minor)